MPRPPRSTRSDTLFPYTTLFRARLGRISKEVGGVALYDGGPGADWLIASDASSGHVFVYDRAADDRWLGAVSLTGADGTPVGEPGGLFATAASLGSRFPNGALVAADEDAPGGSTSQPETGRGAGRER